MRQERAEERAASSRNDVECAVVWELYPTCTKCLLCKAEKHESLEVRCSDHQKKFHRLVANKLKRM